MLDILRYILLMTRKIIFPSISIQKQPSKGVLGKRCTENVQQTYRRTLLPTLPVLRRRSDVATRSLCTSQWRRRYVSNETPNDVSMVRRQDVSVVRLHDFLLERPNDVSKGRNSHVPSWRLRDVSNKSQMKHPTTSQWYFTKMSQWYVSTTFH